ncbi:TPA: hypothetical protein OMD89_004024 [Klebsiella oxytoca]|nr:hypothetical protein [Klebsiella oxytoca]HCQ8707766.1 hypothetical protein [Klebsiella oxytoca]
MEELSSVNKKISDFGFSMTGKQSAQGESGMPKLAPKIDAAQDSMLKDLSVSIDVDTAAARLRRYYKFMTSDELNSIKNKESTSARLTAAAIGEQRPEWSASPGSYYKMGRNWGEGNDHITLEVEKNGVGSRVYIQFFSSNPQHLTEAYLGNLFAQVKNVAEGKVR